MNRSHRFDEVMIVNPYDPSTDGEGEKVMFGYYADPYGYYADPYGYYANPCGSCPGLCQQDEAYGYPCAYAEDRYDPFAIGDEPIGYYADEPYYPDQGSAYGYGYADARDNGVEYGGGDGYADGYGYGDYAAEPAVDIPEQDFAADNFVDFTQPAYDGYVPEPPDGLGECPGGCAGCPMTSERAADAAQVRQPTFEGYVPPADVNASCAGFRSGPARTMHVPETFRPHW